MLHYTSLFISIWIFERGCVKRKLQTDRGLFILGLENIGTIVVTYSSFVWWKQSVVRSLRFTLTENRVSKHFVISLNFPLQS